MTFYQIFTIWSFRNELKYVLLAFLLILSLPIFAVFILTHTGINIVSDKLADIDPQTQKVVIKDPKDGSVEKEINALVVWPVKGVVTLEFSKSSPYQVFHTGIDIANPYGRKGDPVTTFMEGKVIYAGEVFWGYGKHVIIDHGDNITSLYGHLDKIYVYKGQHITPGEVIGNEGETGWATGPHLHFEIRVYGIPVNPRKFLDAKKEEDKKPTETKSHEHESPQKKQL